MNADFSPLFTARTRRSMAPRSRADDALLIFLDAPVALVMPLIAAIIVGALLWWSTNGLN